MKICISSKGDILEPKVDSRFGRSRYFIFIEPENFKCESIKNPNIS